MPYTLALALVAVLALAGCGSSEKPKSEAKGECSYASSGETAARKVDKPKASPVTKEPTEVNIATDRGDIKISLDADKVPCAVNSFLSLAEQNYFDKTVCHRLVTQGIHVLQCGDPSGTGMGGPGYTVKDELIPNDPRLTNCQGSTVCTYPAGTVAMAKSGTAAGATPDTAGSQFFLVFADSPLEPAYQVIGHMSAAGLQVVKSIAEQGNAADGVAPKQPVTITSVKTNG